ncbi:Homocysteine S-methyltransferase 1 [Linnemannia gamsii]|uniref:Homocysteine S-methyltransferase 1 n=1 Tax=Linnemannia gamsii TaxID=64522 RepID=A0ABQ7K6F2_9FUNG|nr:Homocysteine S-methyltransferase 1 [Linnemannia gamsii]
MAPSCEVDPIGGMLKTHSPVSPIYKRAPPPSKGSSDKIIIIVLVAVGSLLFILSLALFYYCVRKRRASRRIGRLQRFLPTFMDQENNGLYFQKQGSSTTLVGADVISKELSPPSNVHHKTRSAPIAITKDVAWLLEHDMSSGQFRDIPLVSKETVVETEKSVPRRSLFGRFARTRAPTVATPALTKSSLPRNISPNKHSSQSSTNSRSDPLVEEDANHLVKFAAGESFVEPNLFSIFSDFSYTNGSNIDNNNRFSDKSIIGVDPDFDPARFSNASVMFDATRISTIPSISSDESLSTITTDELRNSHPSHVTSVHENTNYSSSINKKKRMRNSSAAAASDAKQKDYKRPTTFKEFYGHWKRLLPFIWPSNSRRLQGHIMLCLCLLIAGRVVNVLVPRQVANVVNALSMVAEGSPEGKDENGNPRFVWKEIMVFIMLMTLQGELGVIDTFQALLWIPVGQFNTRELAVKMFEHLFNLSLRFHLNRRTGELLRIQDRGVLSIVTLLSTLLFDILPCLVDIAIACVILTYAFDIYFGITVGVTMICYIYATILMTDWRTRYRREANDLENAVEARVVDCLLNYETVKLFATEEYEAKKYTEAILAYQKADRKSQYSLGILNTTLNVVIQGGLAVGCLLCAQRVSQKEMAVSDFVMYYAYILQLYKPLDQFGYSYRSLQKNFIDMEWMLDLFEEPVEIKDKLEAKPLVIAGGEVVFENVSFGYKPQDSNIKSVSFKIPPGRKLALVGPSGGGKSTILRLLFRFYDPTQGRIMIDGQDIKNVTQSSLRSRIGIVPQDTALFNETIEYNVAYGRIGQDYKSEKSRQSPSSSPKIADATEGEDADYSDDEGMELDSRIQAATEAAQMHEIVCRFPDGYASRVGERGLCLSGGEKQRIAIARTILKNPPILLLDEATSALDTQTEREIQNSIESTSKGRTTLMIAHRLSTIVDADEILVIQRGEIAEQGSHEELMQAGGIYASMWMQQLREDRTPVGSSDLSEKESSKGGDDSDEVDSS